MKTLPDTFNGGDLSEIQPSSSGVEVAIKHPATGKRVGLFVTMRAMESEEVQKVGRSIRTKANKLAVRGKAFTAEEEEANSIEIITAAIVSWRWGEGDDGVVGNWKGEQPNFTPGMAGVILKKSVVIRMQLDAELGDTAQFFR